MTAVPQEPTDRKFRFGGILENPYISMIQRDILDGGRARGLNRTIGPLTVQSVLDVGCGLGENSRVCPEGYVGIDNSLPRVRFAQRRYPQSRFILADARRLPVRPKSFDMTMLIDTSHHLTDAQFVDILERMREVSRRWMLISDPVLFAGQGRLSRFFYRLDRGAMFRSAERMEAIFNTVAGCILERVDFFTTTPGFYRHGVFVLRPLS